MIYPNHTLARFLDRPNRFVAHVEIDGNIETVHVKNTGRCKELLLSGCKVVLTKSENPVRKTAYDLIAVYKQNLGWVNIDSQAPNRVTQEWLENKPEPFSDITLIKPEYNFGNSRIDFYMESPSRRILMEVKGCTLEKDGIGYFPDAPTERGVKHLQELTAAANDGYSCYIAFVIALPGVREVRPNIDTHPEFGVALNHAAEAGVNILYLPCDVSPGSLKIIDVISGK